MTKPVTPTGKYRELGKFKRSPSDEDKKSDLTHWEKLLFEEIRRKQNA